MSLNKGLDFGALRKDRSGTDAPQRAPDGTATVPDPVKQPNRSRTDWKKKYEQLESSHEQLKNAAEIKIKTMEKGLGVGKKAYDKLQEEFFDLKTWADAVKKEETQMYELKDEIHRLKVQDAMSKKAIDRLTLEAEKYKFRPQQFSEIAQLLVSMRVRGNRAQKDAVINIVGTTDIVEVRKYIFKLLEAPYND